MHPAMNIIRGGVVVVTVLRQMGFLNTSKDSKAYKKALESSRAREMYLASIIDKSGIEIDEFDRIALSEL